MKNICKLGLLIVISVVFSHQTHAQVILNSISFNAAGQLVDKNNSVISIPDVEVYKNTGYKSSAVYGFYYHGNGVNIISDETDSLVSSTGGSTTHLRLSVVDNDAEMTDLISISTISAVTKIPLLTLFRDPTGHYWIGKQLDAAYALPGGYGPKNSYLFRLWDPVSPCSVSINSCQTDDVFVNLLPNGQIVIHEIAVLASGSISWQAGMSNFGLPLDIYNPNAAPNPSIANTPPTSQPLNFLAADSVSLSDPYDSFGTSLNPAYGIPNSDSEWAYGAMILSLTEWSGNLFTSSDLSGLINYWNNNLAAPGGPKLTSSSHPCNSGQFQFNGPKDDPLITTQYAPTKVFINTPCN